MDGNSQLKRNPTLQEAFDSSILPQWHVLVVKSPQSMESFRANLPSTDLIFLGVAQRGTQIEKEKEESAWFPRSMANMDILSIRS